MFYEHLDKIVAQCFILGGKLLINILKLYRLLQSYKVYSNNAQLIRKAKHLQEIPLA